MPIISSDTVKLVVKPFPSSDSQPSLLPVSRFKKMDGPHSHKAIAKLAV